MRHNMRLWPLSPERLKTTSENFSVILIVLSDHLGDFTSFLHLCSFGISICENTTFPVIVTQHFIIAKWLIAAIILWSILYGLHSSKGRVTGEKRPATELKLRTYALSRSFSNASHQSLVSLMYWSKVCHYPEAATCTSSLVLYVMVAGSVNGT